MNKQILSLFLFAMPLSGLWAQNRFEATAQEYRFKGPVKTCKFNGYYLRDVVEVTFNKNGDLVEGKSYFQPEELKDLYTTTFDRAGNKTQMKHCNYELECPDCESLIKKEEAASAIPIAEHYEVASVVAVCGSAYKRCKNKPDYVKQQIKEVEDLTYNSKNQLVKTVSSSSYSDYDERVVEYEYDEKGNKVLEFSYRKLNPEHKDTAFLSKNGLMLKDNAYNYVYNDKNQLIERSRNWDKNDKTLYTYYDNGKLKTAIDSREEDTLYCNTNGDTLKLVQRMGWQSISWFDHRVSMPHAKYHTLVMQYGKNNIRTSKKMFDKENNVVYEEVYDKDGQWVKKVFKEGYIERTLDKKKKTESQKLYLNDQLRSVANIKPDGLYVTSYNDKGEISNTIVEEKDKYGNIVKRINGQGLGSLKTYEFTYFE